jgi:hypothetical protein
VSARLRERHESPLSVEVAVNGRLGGKLPCENTDG